jgi:hypothetical protein
MRPQLLDAEGPKLAEVRRLLDVVGSEAAQEAIRVGGAAARPADGLVGSGRLELPHVGVGLLCHPLDAHSPPQAEVDVLQGGEGREVGDREVAGVPASRRHDDGEGDGRHDDLAPGRPPERPGHQEDQQGQEVVGRGSDHEPPGQCRARPETDLPAVVVDEAHEEPDGDDRRDLRQRLGQEVAAGHDGERVQRRRASGTGSASCSGAQPPGHVQDDRGDQATKQRLHHEDRHDRSAEQRLHRGDEDRVAGRPEHHGPSWLVGRGVESPAAEKAACGVQVRRRVREPGDLGVAAPEVDRPRHAQSGRGEEARGGRRGPPCPPGTGAALASAEAGGHSAIPPGDPW